MNKKHKKAAVIIFFPIITIIVIIFAVHFYTSAENTYRNIHIQNDSIDKTFDAKMIWLDINSSDRKAAVMFVSSDGMVRICSIILNDNEEFNIIAEGNITSANAGEIFEKSLLLDYGERKVSAKDLSILNCDLSLLNDEEAFFHIDNVCDGSVDYIFYNNKSYIFLSPTSFRHMGTEKYEGQFNATYEQRASLPLINISMWCNYQLINFQKNHDDESIYDYRK